MCQSISEGGSRCGKTASKTLATALENLEKKYGAGSADMVNPVDALADDEAFVMDEKMVRGRAKELNRLARKVKNLPELPRHLAQQKLDDLYAIEVTSVGALRKYVTDAEALTRLVEHTEGHASMPQHVGTPAGQASSMLGTAKVTDADDDLYSNGWCAVLANALHEKTGWPMVVVSDGPDGTVGWVHAAVQRPDGKIIDVRGVNDRNEWFNQWATVIDAYAEGDDDHDPDLQGIYPAEDHPLGWERSTVPEDETITARAQEIADILIRRHGKSARAA